MIGGIIFIAGRGNVVPWAIVAKAELQRNCRISAILDNDAEYACILRADHTNWIGKGILRGNVFRDRLALRGNAKQRTKSGVPRPEQRL